MNILSNVLFLLKGISESMIFYSLIFCLPYTQQYKLYYHLCLFSFVIEFYVIIYIYNITDYKLFQTNKYFIL